MFNVIEAATFKTMKFSYRFTTKYVIAIPIRKSKIQNALRIPINSDVNLFSVTVRFDAKKRFNTYC